MKKKSMDDERIRRLFRMGKTQAEIAAILGKSFGATRRRLHELRLLKKTSNHWTKDEIVKLKRLFNRGLSYQDIAGQLGRTEWAVIKKVEREILLKDDDIFKAPSVVRRQCQCGRWFDSTGFHHRFCSPCRKRMRGAVDFHASYSDLKASALGERRAEF